MTPRRFIPLVLLWQGGTAAAGTVAPAAIPTFVPTLTTVLSAPADLSNQCVALNQDFKSCLWKASYAVTGAESVVVSPILRASPGSGIKLTRRFTATDGQFSLVIDGVAHPIADGAGTQFFPLPTHGGETISLAVTSSYVGNGDVETSYRSAIDRIELVTDNAALVASTITGAKDWIQATQARLRDYRLQRTLVRYLGLSRDTLADLKTALTGRDADDLSDDCLVDGHGNQDPLDPEQCQILGHINRLLRGEPTEVTPSTLDDAFKLVKEAAEQLALAESFLTQAHAEALAELSQTLQEAKQVILTGGGAP